MEKERQENMRKQEGRTREMKERETKMKCGKEERKKNGVEVKRK